MIRSIVYQPSKSEYKEPYRFNRVAVEAVNLIVNHGIEGDFKSGRNPKRQLNLLSYDVVQQLESEGFLTKPGELGEQIVIEGVHLEALSKGTILQLGEAAQIQINALRTPCSWFELIQGKTIAEATGRVGVMATVIQSGQIRVGDAVKVLVTA